VIDFDFLLNTMAIQSFSISLIASVFFRIGSASEQRHLSDCHEESVVAGQYEALRQFYLSTRMYSEASMVLHNWDFVSEYSMGEYCNFTGIICDESSTVTSLELNRYVFATYCLQYVL
jgi:hypothetical protein